MSTCLDKLPWRYGHTHSDLLAHGNIVGRVLDSAVDWSVEQLPGCLGQLHVVAEVAQVLTNLPLLEQETCVISTGIASVLNCQFTSEN